MQSGKSINYHGPISKRGNKYADKYKNTENGEAILPMDVDNTTEKYKRFVSEVNRMTEKWEKEFGKEHWH